MGEQQNKSREGNEENAGIVMPLKETDGEAKRTGI